MTAFQGGGDTRQADKPGLDRCYMIIDTCHQHDVAFVGIRNVSNVLQLLYIFKHLKKVFSKEMGPLPESGGQSNGILIDWRSFPLELGESGVVDYTIGSG